MVSLRLNTSPRVPSFSGPMALAAVLLLVSVFSEPFWQNFYIIQGKADNTTLKLGAWGACTRLRNTTDVNGDTVWCTSKLSSYEYYFLPNQTIGGVNNFPRGEGRDKLSEATILGLDADEDQRIFVIGKSATSVYWVHVIAAITTVLCVLSLIFPPRYFGTETSRLFALQKSGIITILLALVSCVLALVAFIVEIVVAIPAKNRLDAIDGISAELGNVQWFTLPCFILMIPAILSVLLRSTQQHEYTDL
ncbi:uncharacterized protein JCM10292_005574 [Rhodotorula paludigena]|uniref:uncharacterized protein n=1 Tax=Rhodotorula paludigena TaxID=86838 RepID=UPI00316E8105